MTFSAVCMGVAGLCLLYTAWVLALYPVWLSHQPGRGAPATAPHEPFVSALIPVYNGSQYLAGKLDSILNSDYPPEKLDVLVLSDGSTDATDDIARAYAGTGRVRLLRLPRGGKAAALNAALPHTDREILLLTDVRQTLEPECVATLMESLADPAVGVASGTLLIRKGRSAGEANVGLYWRYESWIRSHLSRYDSLLGATGPIYAIRRALVRPLPPDSLLDDVWLPMQAVLAGYRSVLVERARAWDYPTALITEFNRKIRTQAGIYQLFWHEPRLLTRANRLRLHFLSLKLGRLFLPHALLLLLAASFGFPPWLRVLSLLPQGVFYALAAGDFAVPEGTRMKRLTAPARALGTLFAAAFCAQRIFFVAPQRLWKVTYASAPSDR